MPPTETADSQPAEAAQLGPQSSQPVEALESISGPASKATEEESIQRFPQNADPELEPEIATPEMVTSEYTADPWDDAPDWADRDGEVGDETIDDEMATVDDEMATVILPMQLSRLESAGMTHAGRQRDHNEDNFEIYSEVTITETPAGKQLSAKGLYILCDGMGGHSSGEVASAMVVQQLKAFFSQQWQATLPSEASIRAAIHAANQAVYNANEASDSLGSGRMGTTLVLVLIQNTRVVYAHVGDSRLYAYTRRQGLQQLTVDHEVGQLEVMRGVEPEIAYARPESYQLTQALGPKDNDYIYPEIAFYELQEDTLFLICSDGLSDYKLLEDHGAEKIGSLLSSRVSLEQGVNDLVHLANDLNGHDNITAIAIRAKVRPDPRALKSY